jgi:membrane protease YdiL (CAAX protease family)
MKRSPITAGIAGLLIFIAAIFISNGIVYFIPNPAVWLQQVVLKAVLIVLSLMAIKYILKIPLTEAGFIKPVLRLKKAKIVFSGMGLGALATILIFFTPAKGIPLLKELNGLEFLLIVVIWSSLAEEILVRGFVQSSLKPFEQHTVKIFKIQLSVSVITSALVFAGMHLSLLFAEIDYYTIVFTVITTFLLGLLAGVYREKYHSIIPAIITHMSFNVGGIITGIIIAIIYKILTGELPPH